VIDARGEGNSRKSVAEILYPSRPPYAAVPAPRHARHHDIWWREEDEI